MVKDASVVHPRWADWSQVLSSVLNIGVLNMCPPEGPLFLQTPAVCDLILSDERSENKS